MLVTELAGAHIPDDSILKVTRHSTPDDPTNEQLNTFLDSSFPQRAKSLVFSNPDALYDSSALDFHIDVICKIS